MFLSDSPLVAVKVYCWEENSLRMTLAVRFVCQCFEVKERNRTDGLMLKSCMLHLKASTFV